MYRKGYFMSQQEEQAAKGAVLLQFEEAKHRHALLKIKATEKGKTLESLGKQLQTVPETLTFDSAVLIKLNDEIGKILTDLKTTRDEAQRLAEAVRSIGLGHLIQQ